MMRLKKVILALAAVMPLTMLAQGWPANYAGVMLQGFYWDSYSDTQWSLMTQQADELAELFDLIWVPNSGKTDASGTGRNMGYSPMYWLNHSTCFGTETQLRDMIEAYRQRGTGLLMDLVINHKAGKTGWVDLADESVTGRTTGRKFEVKWDNTGYAQICSNDECNSNGYATGGAADTGENFDGARDLDHTNVTTQQNVRTYMDFLQNELGYVGYRVDMTKGYSPSFTGKYNNWTHPYFSVGEYWDGNADLLRAWLEGTRWAGQIQSATFDYALKYRINEAFNGSSFNASALDNKGLAADANYNRWAVTFVDNHDTGQTDNSSRMSNNSNIAAANALILALPGTPCVFLKHYQSNKAAITNMIKGRRAARVTNQSPITVQQQSSGGYIIEVQGDNGKVYLQLGGATASGTPSGFQLVQSGTNYKFYVSTGIDWQHSTKQGGGVPATITATEPPQAGLTVFVKAADQTSTHLYAWDTSNEPIGATWPGTAIRTLPFCYVAGAKWYYKTFDQGTVNIIFNNGAGGETNQTEDIKAVSKTSFFAYDAPDYTAYSNVTAAVAPYLNYEIPSTATPLDGHVYCYLETSEYATPSIYTWDNSGKQWSGVWNGKKMTQVGTSPTTGNKIWLWDGGEMIDGATPDYLVFNDSRSGGAQTEDMDFVNSGYYTLYGLLGTVADEPLPQPDEVYILGEVGNNGGWYANKGTLMATTDGEHYTAQVTTRGQNSGYSYFSFTKQLAETATDWQAIADYRFGAAATQDFTVTSEQLGKPLPLSDDGGQTAFKIGAGEWDFALNLKQRTLVITRHTSAVTGDLTGDGAVDVADVNLLINVMLGKATAAQCVGTPDLTNDEEVDVADVNLLINIMLGKK